MVSDNGVATCLNAKNGQALWQQRLGGNYSASPIAVDGRVYFLSEEGECTVIAPAKRYEQLAKNRIDERTLASISVFEHALYLRGDRHLFCLEL